MTITATDSRPSAPTEQVSSASLPAAGSGSSTAGSAIPSVFELLLLQQVTAQPATTSETTATSSSAGSLIGSTASVADPRPRATTSTNNGITAAAAAIASLFVPVQSVAGLPSSAIRSTVNGTATQNSALQPFAQGKSNTANPFLKAFTATTSSKSTSSAAVATAVDPAATQVAIGESGTDAAKNSPDVTPNFDNNLLAAKTADVQAANDPVLSASLNSASIPLVPGESNNSASANLPSIELVQRQSLAFATQVMNVDAISAASVTSTRAVAPATVLSSVDPSEDRDSDTASPTLTAMPVITATPATTNSAATPVSDQLATSIVEQLSDMPAGETTTVRLRLDREDLGTVHLHLSVHNDVVSIRIVAQDQLARQVIDSQMADLRQALTGGGIALGHFEVTCDSGRGQSSNGQRTNQAYASAGSTASGRWARPQATMDSAARSVGQLNIVA